MTQDENTPKELDAKSMAEALKLLQEGEDTADMMEKKLDMIEKELERLLAQAESAQNSEPALTTKLQEENTEDSPVTKQ